MKKIMLILFLVSASILTTTMVSCSKENDTMEQNEGNGGEGSEGNEGSGGEAGEGNGGAGEAGESGIFWMKNQTADETVKGVRLILTYNSATSSFEGTLENKNTVIAPIVRVEVHVFDANGNSTEFGPTTPADMQPGEIRNVTLPITPGLNFVKFNMHAEQG